MVKLYCNKCYNLMQDNGSSYYYCAICVYLTTSGLTLSDIRKMKLEKLKI